MLSAESPHEVLSDDDIAFRLKEIGIDIARRTVTKYCEAMNIPARHNAAGKCARQLDCDRGQRARPVWSPWSCSWIRFFVSASG